MRISNHIMRAFLFFFSFFNPGQFMPDEVTERAGEWVHRFHFHRFNGSVRMSGEATPDPRSHLDSPPGPLTSLVPFLASITGTTSLLLSFRTHLPTYPQPTPNASSDLTEHLPKTCHIQGQLDASLGSYQAQWCS